MNILTKPRLEDLRDALQNLRVTETGSGIWWELEQLRAIKEWALGQLPVKAGDRARIRDGFTVTKEHTPGWWSNRECLVPGALCTVIEVDYNSHYRFWQAGIKLDREWAVWEDRGAVTRHHYASEPEDTRHIFFMNVKWLEPEAAT